MTIVGGGLAGLALAAGLDPARFDVAVLEAEPQRRALGSGIGLWPAARRALDRIGALAPLGLPVGPAPTMGSLFDLRGRPLVALRGPDLQLVPRPALSAALHDAMPATVRLETAQVEDPASLDGELVVGADGVRSRVRGLVHPPAAQRIETPYVALRGMTATVDPGAAGEYWGPGRLFGLAPMPDGRGYWFTTHRSALGPEPLDVATVLAEASDCYADAAPVVRQTLAQAGPDTLATRMWVAPPMPRYVRGGYVVIGDAAHASLPNLGRGGCDALLDAVSLADTLNRGGSLAAWQARRLPLTQAARIGAGGMMRLALLDRGHGLRDRALATVGRALPRP